MQSFDMSYCIVSPHFTQAWYLLARDGMEISSAFLSVSRFRSLSLSLFLSLSLSRSAFTEALIDILGDLFTRIRPSIDKSIYKSTRAFRNAGASAFREVFWKGFTEALTNHAQTFQRSINGSTLNSYHRGICKSMHEKNRRSIHINIQTFSKPLTRSFTKHGERIYKDTHRAIV